MDSLLYSCNDSTMLSLIIKAPVGLSLAILVRIKDLLGLSIIRLGLIIFSFGLFSLILVFIKFSLGFIFFTVTLFKISLGISFFILLKFCVRFSLARVFFFGNSVLQISCFIHSHTIYKLQYPSLTVSFNLFKFSPLPKEFSVDTYGIFHSPS